MIVLIQVKSSAAYKLYTLIIDVLYYFKRYVVTSLMYFK